MTTRLRRRVAVGLMVLLAALSLGICGLAWADEVAPSAGDSKLLSSGTSGGSAISIQDKGDLEEAATNSINLGDSNLVNPQQLPDSSFIYDMTIADLATADSYLNGQTVQVVGEVIGDAINAELDAEHCWIVLADDADRTVSVFAPSTVKDQIDLFGRYGQTGTRLQVRGQFNLACEEHQGQTDLHSVYVGVLSKGEKHADKFEIEAFYPGLAVMVVGLLMLFVYWRLRERQR